MMWESNQLAVRSHALRKRVGQLVSTLKRGITGSTEIMTYGAALLSVTAALTIAWWVRSVLHAGVDTSPFLCAILLSAWFGGVRPGLFATVLSVLAIALVSRPASSAWGFGYVQTPTVVVFVLSSCILILLAGTQRRSVESLKLAHAVLQRKHEALQMENLEHEQAKEALRQSEFDLAEAQRVARLGSWNYDIAADSVRWSDELFRIFDIDKKDFGGTYETFLSRVHPDDRNRVLQVNAEVRSNGRPFEVEYRITTRSGRMRHIREVGYAQVELTGEVTRLFGTAQDITERKQAAEESRRNEVLLAEAQQLAHVGSWNWVLESNAITWSDEHYRIFGLHPQEMAMDRDRVFSLIHPDDREEALAKVDQAIRDCEPYDCCLRVLRPDGAERIVHSRGSVVFDEQGRPTRFFGITQDITERMRAEEKLRDYYEQVQSLSRKLLLVEEEERRHLARELHDEFGQLLATVNLHLHAAKGLAGASALPRLNECAGLLQQAGEQVRNLVLELRPTMLDSLGLEAALRWLADHQRKRTGMDVQVVGHFSGATHSMELAIACFRVAQEALTNVLRHASAQHVRIELSDDDRVLQLVVRDDGIGFDAANTQLQAVELARFGLLGMRERVEVLGGSMEVQSQGGRGTAIRATFPRNVECHDRRRPEL